MTPRFCRGCGSALVIGQAYPTGHYSARTGEPEVETWALGCPNGQAYQFGFHTKIRCYLGFWYSEAYYGI